MNMEGNTPKPNTVSKVTKTRLKVTIMPKNLKVMVSVDSSIQIGIFFIKLVALFSEIEKHLKSFSVYFKPVRVELDGYVISPHSVR